MKGEGERKPEEGRGGQEGGSRTRNRSEQGLKEVSRIELSCLETGELSITYSDEQRRKTG